MYYIIFDLEMTMWATKVFKMEDGYVVYDKKKTYSYGKAYSRSY